MAPAVGIAAHAADGDLAPWEFQRHDMGEEDVAIEVKYCGVCHSDVHSGVTINI